MTMCYKFSAASIEAYKAIKPWSEFKAIAPI